MISREISDKKYGDFLLLRRKVLYRETVDL